MILPESIKDCANRALEGLRQRSGKNIYPAKDGAFFLSQRAERMSLQPSAQISANASCHLLATNDQQWIALNLSRASDWELLPALFKNSTPVDNWEYASALAKQNSAVDLVAQGRVLGLAIALAEQPASPCPQQCFNFVCSGKSREDSNSKPKHKAPLVLDLSSLWAGPLCSHLLQETGARVIKVESKQRPDGARLNTTKGGQDFFSALDKNKELVILDFTRAEDIRQLKQMIAQADVVIEGSRPRALQQLGIEAEKIVRQQANLVWISITGYGRCEPQANWIAFGDDAAIAAGLFEIVDNKPVFIGDAIGDPLTGLHAALTALEFIQRGQSVLLDINLHRVSHYCNRKL